MGTRVQESLSGMEALRESLSGMEALRESLSGTEALRSWSDFLITKREETFWQTFRRIARDALESLLLGLGPTSVMFFSICIESDNVKADKWLFLGFGVAAMSIFILFRTMFGRGTGTSLTCAILFLVAIFSCMGLSVSSFGQDAGILYMVVPFFFLGGQIAFFSKKGIPGWGIQAGFWPQLAHGASWIFSNVALLLLVHTIGGDRIARFRGFMRWVVLPLICTMGFCFANLFARCIPAKNKESHDGTMVANIMSALLFLPIFYLCLLLCFLTQQIEFLQPVHLRILVSATIPTMLRKAMGIIFQKVAKSFFAHIDASGSQDDILAAVKFQDHMEETGFHVAMMTACPNMLILVAAYLPGIDVYGTARVIVFQKVVVVVLAKLLLLWTERNNKDVEAGAYQTVILEHGYRSNEDSLHPEQIYIPTVFMAEVRRLHSYGGHLAAVIGFWAVGDVTLTYAAHVVTVGLVLELMTDFVHEIVLGAMVHPMCVRSMIPKTVPCMAQKAFYPAGVMILVLYTRTGV